MTPKQHVLSALELKPPISGELVPTFELESQLTQEFLSRDYHLMPIRDQVCLIGGVQCSLLQTGAEDEIRENCRYVLRHGMPGGGYIHSTTHVAFKGLPLERHLLVLETRERHGRYQ